MRVFQDTAQKQATCILPSKWEIPLNPKDFVSRPDLTKKLFDASRQRLTRIIAPLGCGKTCALADFAAQYLQTREGSKNESQTPPLAWLTLDERDNSPRSFWAYVFTVLKISEALPIEGKQVDREDLERATAVFYERAQDYETILIIDKFECIKNQEIEEGLLYFVTIAPRALHVMLVSSKLSHYMDYASYDLGRIEIGYFNLMFKPSEAEQFIRLRLEDGGEHLDAADFDTIYRMTEGWGQGLSLATEVAQECVLRNVDFVFNGTNSAVNRFFSASVRPLLSLEAYSLALELSVLERFSRQLFTDLFDIENIQELFLELISSGSILTVSCDVEGEWYRFNNLFADWLRNESLQMPTGVLSGVCMKASEWFYSRNQPNEAAKYLLMASDFGYTENVTYATCKLKRKNETIPYLLWLGRIPASSFPESPLLCMLSAWCFNMAGHVAECLSWLTLFEEASKQVDSESALTPERVSFSIKHMKSKCMAMVGNSEEARITCNELLNADVAANSVLVSTMYQSLGEAEEGLGNIAEAREMYLQAQASAGVGKTEHQLFFSILNYADLSMRLGNLDEAQNVIEGGLHLSSANSMLFGGMNALLASIYLERNNIEEAEIFTYRAIKHSSPYRNIDLFLEAKICEASYLAACSQLSDAYEAILGSIMRCERVEIPRRMLFKAYFAQAEIAMKRGNARDVMIVKRKYAERLEDTDAYRRVLFEIVSGFEKQIIGQISTASDYYERAAIQAHSLQLPLLETKALAYELAALNENKDLARQDVVLCKCVSLARTHKLVRSVLDGGKPVFEALKSYSSNKHAGSSLRGYIKQLLIEFNKKTNGDEVSEYSTETTTTDMEFLSPREREVLRLLDMGMSRQEIAESLHVSLNTAKKHLSNIYSKLGVSSREQALNLLSEK